MEVKDQEYFTALQSLLEADKRQLLIVIAFELGVPVFTMKDFVVGKELLKKTDPAFDTIRLVLSLSIICFLAAAWMHWKYMRRVHMNAFAALRIQLEKGVGEEAHHLIFNKENGLYANHGEKYLLGFILLSAAICLYFVFLCLYFGRV